MTEYKVNRTIWGTDPVIVEGTTVTAERLALIDIEQALAVGAITEVSGEAKVEPAKEPAKAEVPAAPTSVVQPTPQASPFATQAQPTPLAGS